MYTTRTNNRSFFANDRIFCYRFWVPELAHFGCGRNRYGEQLDVPVPMPVTMHLRTAFMSEIAIVQCSWLRLEECGEARKMNLDFVMAPSFSLSLYLYALGFCFIRIHWLAASVSTNWTTLWQMDCMLWLCNRPEIRIWLHSWFQTVFTAHCTHSVLWTLSWILMMILAEWTRTIFNVFFFFPFDRHYSVPLKGISAHKKGVNLCCSISLFFICARNNGDRATIMWLDIFDSYTRTKWQTK